MHQCLSSWWTWSSSCPIGNQRDCPGICDRPRRSPVLSGTVSSSFSSTHPSVQYQMVPLHNLLRCSDLVFKTFPLSHTFDYNLITLLISGSTVSLTVQWWVLFVCIIFLVRFICCYISRRTGKLLKSISTMFRNFQTGVRTHSPLLILQCSMRTCTGQLVGRAMQPRGQSGICCHRGGPQSHPRRYVPLGECSW